MYQFWHLQKNKEENKLGTAVLSIQLKLPTKSKHPNSGQPLKEKEGNYVIIARNGGTGEGIIQRNPERCVNLKDKGIKRTQETKLPFRKQKPYITN